MVKGLVAAWAALLCSGCSTYDVGGFLAAGSSPEERFDNSMADYTPRSVDAGGESYRFRVATDMHIRNEDWPRVERFLARTEDSGATLLLLLGDYMHEAGSSLEPLAGLFGAYGVEAFPTIGNHEVYKRGYQDDYRPVFGATCYAFRVQTGAAHDLFVAMDSANGTLGRRQMRWLEEVLAAERPAANRCFVFTHANFFQPGGHMNVISTYPLEEQMKLLDIFSDHGVTAVFSGHSHVRDQTTVAGVDYITVGCWSDEVRGGEYCEVACSPDGVQTAFYPVE